MFAKWKLHHDTPTWSTLWNLHEFRLYFALANHSLVVQTNFGYGQPYMVDVVIVQLGQSVDVLVTTNHTSRKFYMAATPFSMAPYSIVSSQILHHDAFYPLQI